MTRVGALKVWLFAVAALAAGTAAAREGVPSKAESFTIGTSGSVCDAQGVGLGAARLSLFERKWAILCRDVAQPIGSAYVLRGGESAAARLTAARSEALTCLSETNVDLGGGQFAQLSECSAASGLAWKSYLFERGGRLFVVEGLSAYDSALRLALRNLVEDRVVPGEVEIASTGSGEGSTAAALRATTNPQTLIGLGYRSNNAGAFIDAAELFAADEVLAGTTDERAIEQAGRLHEMAINRALQFSNLGEFQQAARLVSEAGAIGASDPVQARLSRNYRAIDALNQGDLEGVLAVLDEPPPALAISLEPQGDSLRIDRATAVALNSAPTGQLAGVVGLEARLSVPERVAIIDAQAEQLRGTVARLSGRLDEARSLLSKALQRSAAVREGRVLSTIRLNAQILSELALIHEAKGQSGEAEGLLRRALTMVEGQYPDSASVNNARARLAGFLARHGQQAEARAIFRSVVENVASRRSALVGMTNLMRPYFDLLVGQKQADPQAMPELFVASQLVERPGAADAMELLARRLAGGDAAASALFRQSQEIARELERTRMLVARQSAAAAAGGTAPALPALAERQQRLVETQAKMMNALGAYPQYRAVSNRTVRSQELQALLKSDEAYLKLVELGGAVYAVYLSPTEVQGWRVSKSAEEIAFMVGALRATISLNVGGAQQTFPFDVDNAAELHDALLGPVAAQLAGVRHLMFEPDGAMLKLPLALLTGDRAGIAAYHQRVASGGNDFDFTGIKWLGRTAAISTALSAATFRDARGAPASKGTRTYLGLGENVPLGPVTSVPSVRGVDGNSQEPGCDWPAAIWNRPISARELREASTMFRSGKSDLMTDGAFTDTAVMQRDDLASYRVIHFATHGLVSAPRDGCPARPALLTSFGGPGSDGLLGFAEIFDLQLDADLVILSACDTAAQASVEATREAGVSTGGGQALDGLVRAFIAAGGRQVIASHWPAPDDYGATRRLFAGFFMDKDDSVAGALQHAQQGLMDDPLTSHPFYWAGMAVVGDGGQALRLR